MKTRLCFFGFSIFFTLLANQARAEDPVATYEVPPPKTAVDDETEQVQPRRGLITAGKIVFGTSYVLGAASALMARSGTPGRWLFIPAAGPWIGLISLSFYNQKACFNNTEDSGFCPDKDAAYKIFAMHGIVQLTGLGLIAAGYRWWHSEETPGSMAKSEIELGPLYASGKISGLLVSGRF
jgi:hypothetical protein